MHSVVNAASESKYELPLASMKPEKWLSGLANLFQCAITPDQHCRNSEELKCIKHQSLARYILHYLDLN